MIVWGPLANPVGLVANMGYLRPATDTHRTVYTTTSVAPQGEGLNDAFDLLRKENKHLQDQIDIIKKFAMQEALAPEVREEPLTPFPKLPCSVMRTHSFYGY